MKRDSYHRCRYCKGLFRDEECTPDPVKGLVCPNACQPSFEQPPYEPPTSV